MKPLVQQFREGSYTNPGSFEMAMFNLFGIADGINRAKLRKSFPIYFGEPTAEDIKLLDDDAKQNSPSMMVTENDSQSEYEEKTIPYASLVHFTGRNGNFKQTGLTVERSNKVITLQPITSRSLIGRCSQQIPLDHVPLLIEALQQLSGCHAKQ